jgi:hypothetical protein
MRRSWMLSFVLRELIMEGHKDQDDDHYLYSLQGLELVAVFRHQRHHIFRRVECFYVKYHEIMLYG